MMLKTYLKSVGILNKVTTDRSTGAILIGEDETVQCQVVDDTSITGASAGRDLSEGSKSLVIVSTSVSINAGDKFTVSVVRGISVDRPTRIVQSVTVVGGFRASHKEVLI
jgi:hypothetical protein